MKIDKVIYLDFDGTVVEHAYPEMGKPVPFAIDVLKKLQKAGWYICINTYRENINFDRFMDAIIYLRDCDTPVIESTNGKKDPLPWQIDSDMCEMYIDDLAENIPLIPATEVYRPMVDWKTIDEQFKLYGIYDQT